MSTASNPTSIAQAVAEAKKPEPNPCGSCSMCCKLPAIPELSKPINRWCTHCKPSQGGGCTIYEARPEVCSGYSCLWKSRQMRPELRPDRCKFVLEAIDDSAVIIIRTAPELFDAVHNSSLAAPIVASLMDAGVDVRVTDGNRMRVFKPGIHTGMGRRWEYRECFHEGRFAEDGTRLVTVGKVLMSGTTAQGRRT